MKNAVSRFGKFLSGMVMPNIGAFIAWGFLTALFIEAGWFPNEKLASMVSPMLTYLLPILIGALLRRAKIASSHHLEVGNFVMDVDEHTAYLGEEEISLTTREFNLLYQLLSYPRKTFTRTQLLDEFWDADTASGPRTVDVYMTKLRSKLARCDAFEIVTVHGLGYKAVIK